MTDNDFEILLEKLDNNFISQTEDDMDPKMKDYLQKNFEANSSKKDAEIERLQIEKKAAEEEMKRTKDNYILLQRNIDLLKHEAEIHRIKSEQHMQEILRQANDYTDEQVADIEGDIIENAKTEVEKLLVEFGKEHESKGLSGTGQAVLSNLFEHIPNLLAMFMTMKKNGVDLNSMKDNFSFNSHGLDGFPNHEYYDPAKQQQDNVNNNTESTQNSDNNFNNNTERENHDPETTQN